MLVWVGVLLSRFVAVYAARVALFIIGAARSCITSSQKHHCARDSESKGRHSEAEREDPHAALLEFSRGASGIYYECKRAVPLRFQRQLHKPNRRYTFTGDLRGIVDLMPTLQQTHYGSQYPNGP